MSIGEYRVPSPERGWMPWDNVSQTEGGAAGRAGETVGQRWWAVCTICRLGRACRVAAGQANLPCPAVLRPALIRLRKTLVGGTQGKSRWAEGIGSRTVGWTGGRAGPASQKLADPKCSLQRWFTTRPAAAVAAAASWEEELGVEEAWAAGVWGAAVWAAGLWSAEAGAAEPAAGAWAWTAVPAGAQRCAGASPIPGARAPSAGVAVAARSGSHKAPPRASGPSANSECCLGPTSPLHLPAHSSSVRPFTYRWDLFPT